MIVVRAPRLKILFLFALSLIMVAASAWLTLTLPVAVLTWPVGLAGIGFFGLAGGWLLSRLFSNRVSLVLTQEGLLDNSTALPAGRIAWDQIVRVGITTVEKQRFLGIDVRDRSLLTSSDSAFRRWIKDSSVALAGYPVNVPSTVIDRTLEELHDLILRYWKEPKARAELGSFDAEARTR